MTAYRRNFVPGGCFFFTVNLAERKLSLLTDHVELLRAAFRGTHQCHPFTIDAIVVLPDHLHTVWTLPEGDAAPVTDTAVHKRFYQQQAIQSFKSVQPGITYVRRKEYGFSLPTV